jgi:hypothetical protein
MASEEQPAGACAPKPRRVYVRWSEEVADRLLTRLAAGELLYRICREPEMPSPEGVAKWAKKKPGFGNALRGARQAGGRPAGSRGPVTIYCEGIAEEIFERVCEGESLTKIGKDPTMPCVWTIFRWRHERPQFEALMQLGMRIRGELAVDRADELVEGATPETAYLTHVQLTHLRWKAGAMAPRAYRVKLVEPEQPQEVRTILFRHFEIEVDKATGKRKVVAYCPNPITGQVEREDTPGWRQAGDANTGALPGGRMSGQGYRADPG